MSAGVVRYVVDATIAIKWFYRDEEHVAEAEAILRSFQTGDIELLAPDHLCHETLNGFRTGVRTSRLTHDRARQFMRDFLRLEIPTISGSDLFALGFEFALRFDCAFYDALNLALADQAECPFVHADRRLRNTLNGRFARELWIEDYEPIRRET